MKYIVKNVLIVISSMMILFIINLALKNISKENIMDALTTTYRAYIFAITLVGIIFLFAWAFTKDKN